MNKFYVISPLILFLLFGGYFYHFHGEQQIKEKEKKARIEKLKQDEETKRKISEDRARKDAEERTRKRDEDAKKKEDEKRANFEKVGREIADATAKQKDLADASAKKSADLEMQLNDLRRRKEAASREAFELTKQVELARIEKRTAELEIQRMTDMVIRRAADSTVTRLPPPPPQPPTAK